MQGPHLRKYGVQTTIDFTLYKIDGTALQPAAAHAAGDTKIMKDEAAEGNTTNAFTDEGQTYSIVLTATEMQAARIVLIIVDQTAPQAWLDTTIVIDTYGHASAQHAFDLATASTAQTGDNYARLGAPAGASVSADVLQVKGYVDDIGAAGAGLSAIPWNAAWDAEVQSEAQDAITASALATAANLATVDTVVDGIATDVAAVHVHAQTIETDVAAVHTHVNDIHDTDLPAVKADTAAILVDTAVIGALGAGLTAVPWNAAWDAEVQSEAQDAITASALATAANLATVDTVVDGIATDVAAVHVHAQTIETDVAAVHTHVGTIDGHITADYGATEKTCVDLLDDAAGGLADIHTDVAAVKSDTAAILTDTGTTLDGRIPAALVGGRIDASVGSVAANAIDAAAIKDGAIDAATFAAGAINAAAVATDAIDADAISADGANEIADALLDRANAVETSITLRQATRLILAALAGKLSGAGTTTITIRNVGDAKDRIVATVDVDGNRTAVTTDVY